jgi:tetratricopeptide (TPR) repeat protein
MPTAPAAAGLAAALALPGALWAQGGSGPGPRYVELLESYASGRQEGPVAALASWSEDDLKRETGALRALADAARACASCAARRTLERLPLRAAVLLHTDVDVRVGTPAPDAEMFTPRCGPRVHDVLAERLLSVLMRRPEEHGFGRRWYLAMALRTHWDLCPDDAARWVRAALAWFPDDAELLLARGTAEDVAELRRPESLPARGVLPPRLAREAEAEAASRRQLLERAKRSFEEALKSNPGLHEARVRLGGVLWRLGRRAEARACLEPAVAAGAEPSLLYLAHLFLGRVHEDEGRLPQAEAAYRAAVGVEEDGQAAAVALSHVLQAAGQAEASREVLDRLVRQAWRPADDPYWAHRGGRYLDAEALLEELRGEVRP